MSKMTMKLFRELAEKSVVAAPCSCWLSLDESRTGMYSTEVFEYCLDSHSCVLPEFCDALEKRSNKPTAERQADLRAMVAVGYAIAARDLKEQRRSERNRKAKRKPSVRARSRREARRA